MKLILTIIGVVLLAVGFFGISKGIRGRSYVEQIRESGVTKQAEVVDKKEYITYKGSGTRQLVVVYSYALDRIGNFIIVPQELYESTAIGDKVEVRHLDGDPKYVMMGNHRCIHLSSDELPFGIGIGIAGMVVLIVAWKIRKPKPSSEGDAATPNKSDLDAAKEIVEFALALDSGEEAEEEEEDDEPYAFREIAPQSTREGPFEFDFALNLQEKVKNGWCRVEGIDAEALPDCVISKARLSLAMPELDEPEEEDDELRASLEFELGGISYQSTSRSGAGNLCSFLIDPYPATEVPEDQKVELLPWSGAPEELKQQFAGSDVIGPLFAMDDSRAYIGIEIGPERFTIRTKYLGIIANLVCEARADGPPDHFIVLVTNLKDSEYSTVPPFYYRIRISDALLVNDGPEWEWEMRDEDSDAKKPELLCFVPANP